MAVKNFCPETRPKEPDVGKRIRGEDVENDMDCLEQFPRCPACKREYDMALILPCSHTMCACCVAAGEDSSSTCPSHRRGARQPVCSVLCPCCRRPVELPCWTWSAATSCLPNHPTLRSECVAAVTDNREGSPEDHLQHGQGEETEQTSLYGTDVSSSVTPVEGAVDLQEQEMERSVFGLRFALDPSTVPPSLHLSNSSLTVTYHGQTPAAPPPQSKIRKPTMNSDPEALLHVCGDVVLAQGQYYWEVDVCNSSIYRIGVMPLDSSGGWWLQRHSWSFCAVYDGGREPLCTVPPQIKTLGVFLNVGGGTLSFYNPLTQEHLTTLPTRFGPAGVLPALGLGQGRLRLRCGLPPPPHVFLGKDSAYRGPRGAGGGRWHGEVSFQSVRRVIQKFEQLALSDSESGLVSSFGSSCSTLASLSDVGIPGSLSAGQDGQETEAEWEELQ
ncbi:uncharacterized protein [Embiotoca jacksoni]|uniref:uncharacterized protein n=1 Tax=Embiotoca jacksoni TaxID=100190 RepID=UPI00370452D1